MDIYRTKHTNEVRNLNFPVESQVGVDGLLGYQADNAFWTLLEAEDLSLAASREYEHLVYLIDADDGRPWLSHLELPHPSGLWYDQSNSRLIVSSTRTPNQILAFRPIAPGQPRSAIIPDSVANPAGTLFVPVQSFFLPGSIYTHDLVVINGEIYLTATGHNFLARVDAAGGFERVWWPKVLDSVPAERRFSENYLQLNSIAPAASLDGCFFTAFSDQTTGPKPWKEGYGPRGKGVVYSGASREVVCRGLTCPHSARIHRERIWVCNSGYGEVGVLEVGGSDGYQFRAVLNAPGFTRGLAFFGDYGFVGLSKVIPFYEPYAPGLDPAATHCGILAFHARTGEIVGSLTWPDGYQMYDVQVLPGFRRPLLPDKPKDATGMNELLRYFGWDLDSSR